MRKSVIFLIISSLLSITSFAQSVSAPDALLQSGIAAYRTGNYTGAVTDLQAASQAYLSPQRMQTYVNTGRFEGLESLETALVYLALAQSRLGREEDARETVVRLMTAERIEPTYANIRLEADAAEFEPLVARLVPTAGLPRNVQLAGGTALPTVTPATTVAETAPLPTVTPAETAPLPTVTPATTVAETAPQTSSAPAPVIVAEGPRTEPAAPATTTAQTGEKLVVQPTLAAEREERQRIIEELVARERERIQREADARIAALQRETEERIAAVQREALTQARNEAQTEITQVRNELTQVRTESETRVNEARAEAQRMADERIASAQRDAEARVTAAQRDAETRIAAAQRTAEQQIAEARAEVERAAQARIAAAEADTRRAYLTSLRQAEAFASNEKFSEANQIYVRVANSESVPREVLTEAAIGLYRTGAFRQAVDAFQRLGTFQRGEEDLRYYNAVALYETGNYAAAKKELSCALPFIQVTDDVSRYRAKIEQTASRQALR